MLESVFGWLIGDFSAETLLQLLIIALTGAATAVGGSKAYKDHTGKVARRIHRLLLRTANETLHEWLDVNPEADDVDKETLRKRVSSVTYDRMARQAKQKHLDVLEDQTGEPIERLVENAVNGVILDRVRNRKTASELALITSGRKPIPKPPEEVLEGDGKVVRMMDGKSADQKQEAEPRRVPTPAHGPKGGIK